MPAQNRTFLSSRFWVRAHVPRSSAQDLDLHGWSWFTKVTRKKIWQGLEGPIKLRIYLEAIPNTTQAPSFKTICKRIKQTKTSFQPNRSKDFPNLSVFLFLWPKYCTTAKLACVLPSQTPNQDRVVCKNSQATQTLKYCGVIYILIDNSFPKQYAPTLLKACRPSSGLYFLPVEYLKYFSYLVMHQSWAKAQWQRPCLVSTSELKTTKNYSRHPQTFQTKFIPGQREKTSSHLKARQPSKTIPHAFTYILTLPLVAQTKLVAMWQAPSLVNLLHEMIPCQHLQLWKIMFLQIPAACYFAT